MRFTWHYICSWMLMSEWWWEKRKKLWSSLCETFCQVRLEYDWRPVNLTSQNDLKLPSVASTPSWCIILFILFICFLHCTKLQVHLRYHKVLLLLSLNALFFYHILQFALIWSAEMHLSVLLARVWCVVAFQWIVKLMLFLLFISYSKCWKRKT